MWNWIVTNKEWIFSGIGVVAIGYIIQFVFRLLQSRHKTSQPSESELLSGVKAPSKPSDFEILPISFNMTLSQQIPQIEIWVYVVNYLSRELTFQTLRVNSFNLLVGPSLENISAIGEMRVPPRQSRQILFRRPLADSEARAIEDSQQDKRNPRNATFSIDAVGDTNRKHLRRNFPVLSANGWISGISNSS